MVNTLLNLYNKDVTLVLNFHKCDGFAAPARSAVEATGPPGANTSWTSCELGKTSWTS